MKSVYFGRLEIRLREAMEQRAAHLIGGGAKDMAEYREGVGYIAGLHESLRVAEELDGHMLGFKNGEPGPAD
jgi:hypothetical protein